MKILVYDDHGKPAGFVEGVELNGRREIVNISTLEGGGSGSGTGFVDTDGALEIVSDILDDTLNGVAFTLDTTDLMTLAVNLLEVKNNGSVRLRLDKDGTVYSPASFTSGLGLTTGASLGLGIFDAYSPTAEVVLDVGGVGGGHWFTRPTLGFTFDEGDTWDFLVDPSASDGTTAFKFNATIAQTSGSLVDILNDGTSKFQLGYDGRIIVPSAPPAAADSTGVAGSITWDAGFIYVCVATDTWKRVAIATWP